MLIPRNYGYRNNLERICYKATFNLWAYNAWAQSSGSKIARQYNIFKTALN